MTEKSSLDQAVTKRSHAVRIMWSVFWICLTIFLLAIISGIIGMMQAPGACIEKNLPDDMLIACARVMSGPLDGYFLVVTVLALIACYFGKLPGTGRDTKLKKTN